MPNAEIILIILETKQFIILMLIFSSPLPHRLIDLGLIRPIPKKNPGIIEKSSQV